MSTLEQRLWRRVRKALAPHGRVSRVENPLEPGMPDVSYCLDGVEGWLELKALPAWPKKPGTIVGPRLVRPAQRAWWLRQLAAGGRIYMLLAVGERRPDHVLLTGEVAILKSGRIKAELEHWSLIDWYQGLDGKELTNILKDKSA